jgi:hypothetical protein
MEDWAESAEAIDKVHAWVALTLTESPCVDEFRFPTLTAGASGANDPSWTFTLGGTVRLTVWTTLDEPTWAVAERAMSAVANTAAKSVRPSPTIYRASRNLSKARCRVIFLKAQYVPRSVTVL